MVAVSLTPKLANVDAFLGYCHKRSYRAKNTIIYAGDASDALFYIISGSVTVVIEDDDGKEMIDMGASGYLVHFNSGVQIWKKNKIFGKGLKSFRLNCTYGNNQTCNTHPHNYIIELLLDVGIVGLTLIYLIFIFSVFNFFNFYKHNSNLKLLSFPFFLIVVLEFFPLRSSGSFFTTSNATVIFFMLAVVVGLSSSKKNR